MPKSKENRIPASFVPSPGPIYMIPPTIGYETHSPVITRAPAYSFGTRPVTHYSKLGPGPAAYVPNTAYTRFGPAGTPQISMASRHRALKLNQTPGPGAYAPEKYPHPMSRRPPGWSMSDRTKLHKTSVTPGPAAYNLQSNIGSRPQNKKTAPAYTISGRTKMNDFTHDYANSPGPAAYYPANTYAYRKSPPSYSMVSRREELGLGAAGPGPAAYIPDINTIKRSPPTYSMGIRHSPWKAQVYTDKGNDFYLE